MFSGCTSQKNNTDSSGCTSAVVKHDPAVLSQQILIAELHQDTINYRDRILVASGSISVVDLRAIDRLLVRPMYQRGIRSSLGAFYPLAGDNLPSASIALWSIASTPSQLTFVNVVSGNYSRPSGLTFNGSSSYARTGVIPSAHFTTSAGHMAFFANVNSGTVIDMGASPDQSSLSAQPTACVWRSYNASTGNLAVAIATPDKTLVIGDRTAINNSRLYHNSTQIGSIATGGGTLPTVEFYLGAMNVSGSASFISAKTYGMFALGPNGIGAEKISDFVAICRDWLRYMGRI